METRSGEERGRDESGEARTLPSGLANKERGGGRRECGSVRLATFYIIYIIILIVLCVCSLL
jgi:hypothetical protein